MHYIERILGQTRNNESILYRLLAGVWTVTHKEPISHNNHKLGVFLDILSAILRLVTKLIEKANATFRPKKTCFGCVKHF